MTELERVVDAIEHGLLPVRRSAEQPVEKAALEQHMREYKVPGVSVAFVHEEAPAWGKSWGGPGGRRVERRNDEQLNH